MKKTIEAYGKKVEDAIADGLRALGATIDEVDVEVVSHGGLFKKAKVKITIETPESLKAAAEEAKRTESPKVFSEPEKEKEKQPPVKESLKQAPDTKKAEKPENNKKPDKQDRREKPENGGTKPNKTEESPKKQFSFEKKSVLPRDNGAIGEKPAKNFEKRKPEFKNAENRKTAYKPRDKAEVTEIHLEKCKVFITGLLEQMGIEGSVIISENDGVNVEIQTKDSLVIGRRGETLDAIQYLTGIVLGENNGEYVSVYVDALGYRAARNETLKALAERMAEKCVKTGRKVALDPMTSAERRVIHSALQDNAAVTTRSEGHDPGRRIVIFPACK